MAYYLTSFSKLFSSFSKSGKQISWHIMATTLKLEQRCVIKFCANANMTPTDTLKFIQRGNQHTDVSRSLVFAWHKKFRDGLDDVFDKPRSIFITHTYVWRYLCYQSDLIGFNLDWTLHHPLFINQKLPLRGHISVRP